MRIERWKNRKQRRQERELFHSGKYSLRIERSHKGYKRNKNVDLKEYED